MYLVGTRDHFNLTTAVFNDKCCTVCCCCCCAVYLNHRIPGASFLVLQEEQRSSSPSVPVLVEVWSIRWKFAYLSKVQHHSMKPSHAGLKEESLQDWSATSLDQKSKDDNCTQPKAYSYRLCHHWSPVVCPKVPRGDL